MFRLLWLCRTDTSAFTVRACLWPLFQIVLLKNPATGEICLDVVCLGTHKVHPLAHIMDVRENTRSNRVNRFIVIYGVPSLLC